MSGRDVLKNHCAEIRISKDPAHIIKTTPSATAAIRSATLHRLQSDLMSGIGRSFGNPHQRTRPGS
jgi:hypothetical protein